MSESIVNLLVSCSFPTKSIALSAHSYQSMPLMVITLDGRRNPSVLKTFNVLRCQLSSEKGVFGERLKVATAEGMAVHADCWGEKHFS